MLFRVIAFLVGLIAVIAGYRNYDSTVSSSTIPIILGGLVMLIGIFNLMPQIKNVHPAEKKSRKKQSAVTTVKAINLLKIHKIQFPQPFFFANIRHAIRFIF